MIKVKWSDDYIIKRIIKDAYKGLNLLNISYEYDKNNMFGYSSMVVDWKERIKIAEGIVIEMVNSLDIGSCIIW